MLDSLLRSSVVDGMAIDIAILVDGRYDLLENVLQGRVSAEELQRVVEGFGEPLVVPPKEALDAIEVVELDDVDGCSSAIARFALWTKDGPSDLIMEEVLVNRVSIAMRPESLKVYRAGERPAG